MAHGNYTQQVKDDLAEVYRKELREKSKTTTLINALKEQVGTEVVPIIPDGFTDFDSYRAHKKLEREEYNRKFKLTWGIQDDPTEDSVIEVGETPAEVSADEEYDPIVFTCIEDVENVSFGPGEQNIFSLFAGGRYEAPHWVVAHLAEKHLVRI